MWTPSVDRWDFPRSIAGLAVVTGFARDRGLTHLIPTELTAGAGGEVREVLPAEVELHLLRGLAAATAGEEAPGLELGGRYHLTTFGILGFALLSSRTVREVVDLTLRFLDLTHVFTRPAVAIDGGLLVVTLEPLLDTDDPVLVRFVVERDLAAILTVLQELLPDAVPLAGVDLAFPAPADPAPYVEGLGVTPRFGAPATSVRLDARLLDRALPQGNPHSAALAEAMCRDLAAARRPAPDLVDEVRLWITRHLATGAHAADAARALSLSERTLRRRLADSGVGFQGLLDDVRHSLAERMLATGVLTVDDVAQRLGYAEASSFIHAFRRWTGTTPARYRAEGGSPGAASAVG